jgi:hypothetical protein
MTRKRRQAKLWRGLKKSKTRKSAKFVGALKQVRLTHYSAVVSAQDLYNMCTLSALDSGWTPKNCKR